MKILINISNMSSIKRWYLHRKWLRRYRLAWKNAIRDENLHPNFYEHSIEYWTQQELKYLKQKR